MSSPSTQTEASQKYVDFEEYIAFQVDKTRSSIKATDIVTAAVGIATALVGYLFLFTLIDHWIIPGGVSQSWRTGLWLTLAAGISFASYWLVVRPSMQRVTELYAAQSIEQHSPELKDTLLNLVDLQHRERKPIENIENALQKRAALSLAEVDIEQTVDRRPLMWCSYALLAIVVSCCLYTVFSPKDISFRRAFWPLSAVDVATQTRLVEVLPGDSSLLAGVNMDVTVRTTGKKPDQVTLFFTTDDQRFVKEPLELRAVDEHRTEFAGVLLGENGRGIRQDFSYTVQAGDAYSGEYRVTVQQPPSVTIENVEAKFPAYMQLDSILQSSGHLDVWDGTEVTWQAIANQPVKSAKIVFSSQPDFAVASDEFGMTVGSDGRSLTATWPLKIVDGSHPNFYRIEATNEAGESSYEPAVYNVKVSPDQKPIFDFFEPKGDLQMPANGIIPLNFQVHDPDFLLSDVQLKVHKDRELIYERAIFDGNRQGHQKSYRTRTPYEFRLSPLKLRVGEVITFSIEARDNREPHRNSASTPQLRVEIVEPVSKDKAEENLKEEKQRQKEAIKEEQEKAADDQQQPGQKPAEQDQGEQQPAAEDGDPNNESKESTTEEGKTEKGETSDGNQGEQQPGDNTSEAGKDSGTGDSNQQGSDDQSQSQSKESGDGDEANQDGAEGDSSSNESSGEQSDDEILRKLLDREQENSGEGNNDSDNSSDDKKGENKTQDNTKDSDDRRQSSDENARPEQSSDQSKEKGDSESKPQGADKADSDSTNEPGNKTSPESTKPKSDSADKSDQKNQPADKIPGSDAKDQKDKQQPASDSDANKKSDKNNQDSDLPDEDKNRSDQRREQGNPEDKSNSDSGTGKTEKNMKQSEGDKGKQDKNGEPAASDEEGADGGAEKDSREKGDSSKPSKPEKNPINKENNQNEADEEEGNKSDKQDGDQSGTESKNGKQKGSQTTDDDENARREKATGDEKGEGTPDNDPDADPTKSKNNDQIKRKEGTDPVTKPSDDKPQGDPKKGQPNDKQVNKQDDSTDKKQMKSGDKQKSSDANNKNSQPSDSNKKGDQNKNENSKKKSSQKKSSQKNSDQKGNEKSNQDKKSSQKNDSSGKPDQSKGDKGENPGSQSGDSSQSSDSKSGDSESGQGGPSDESKGDSKGSNSESGNKSKDGSDKKDKADQDQKKPRDGEQPKNEQSKDAPKKKGGDQRQQPGGEEEGGQGSSESGSPSSGGSNNGGEYNPNEGGNGGTDAKPGDGGNGAGEEGNSAVEGDDPDLEAGRKATDLVLKRLQKELERGEVDADWLKKHGFTKQSMKRFVDRMQKRMQEAESQKESSDALARRRHFNEMLRRVGSELKVKESAKTRRGSAARDRSSSGFGTGRQRIPAEYREIWQRYSKSLSRRKQAPPAKK